MRLGDKVRCKVTGFYGTVVKRCEYLYGSIQLEVRGYDGGFRRDEWLEEQGVELLEAVPLAEVTNFKRPQHG